MPVILVPGWLVATRSSVQYYPQIKQIQGQCEPYKTCFSKATPEYLKNLGVLAQHLKRGYSQDTRLQ